MNIIDRIASLAIGQQRPKASDKTKVKSDVKPTANTPVETGKPSSDQDSAVKLSPTLKNTQAVMQAVNAEPGIREARVAELKEQIENKTYRIDHDAVAEKLVDAFGDDLS